MSDQPTKERHRLSERQRKLLIKFSPLILITLLNIPYFAFCILRNEYGNFYFGVRQKYVIFENGEGLSVREFSPVGGEPVDLWYVSFAYFLFWFILSLYLIGGLLQVARKIIPQPLTPEEKWLRKYANDICPECGYDVRATRERCPECGTDLSEVSARMRLRLPE